MAQGRIDSTFMTEQRDLFASGVVAEIGVNAYAVWHAIKHHADFETGQAFPGMSRLSELTGLAKSGVHTAVKRLESAHMLRIVRKSAGKNRGQTYIARERLSIRLGSRVICVIVVDYVPAKLRGTLSKIEEALTSGKDVEALAEVEIIPGDGFTWDETTGTLKGQIKAKELPNDEPENDHYRAIGEAMFQRAKLPKK